MFCVKITDKLKTVYKYPNYQIIIGRDKRGNDHIIEYYSFVKDRCYWFHLANESSSHIILYLENDIDKRELITIFKDIKKEITSKKKDDVIFCKLEDVISTKSMGTVICNNKTLMSDDNWVSRI
jgi:predicted ribosome quality control (RQC) complex YloA/Tae2 family protein